VADLLALCSNGEVLVFILKRGDLARAFKNDIPAVGGGSFGEFNTAACGVFTGAEVIVGIIFAVCVLNTVNNTYPSAGIRGGEHFKIGADRIITEIAEPRRKNYSCVVVFDVTENERAVLKRITVARIKEGPTLVLKLRNVGIFRKINFEKNVFGFVLFLFGLTS
jgi:hypothetical protein